MTDPMYQFTHDQLATLLDYTVHRGDCEQIIYRTDERSPCTCGLSRALDPIRLQTAPGTSTRSLASNIHVFRAPSRSAPQWLLSLIPTTYRPVSHRNPHTPSERSDG